MYDLVYTPMQLVNLQPSADFPIHCTIVAYTYPVLMVMVQLEKGLRATSLLFNALV